MAHAEIEEVYLFEKNIRVGNWEEENAGQTYFYLGCVCVGVIYLKCMFISSSALHWVTI